MKKVIATLESVSPYSQSRHYDIPRDQGESHNDWYKRTCKNHCHVDEKGMCFIPPMALGNVVKEAAQYLSLPVPGKGKATYTKNFKAGILVVEPVPLKVHIDDVEIEALYLNADGRKGGSTRVMKYYPCFRHWTGDVEYIVFDETVLQTYSDKSAGEMTVFQHVLGEAGKFVGIGRFNPQHGGYYGRFDVKGLIIA